MSEAPRRAERLDREASAATPPPRGEPAMVARSPVFAVLALVIAGWFVWDLWPDAAYFFAPRDPVTLGVAGAYHLERARENRLVRIGGELADAVQVTETRTDAQRVVGWIAGTNVIVDRPGPSGPAVFEGRILPARARSEYAEIAAALRARGAPLGDRWLVLRDGDRPRRRWIPVVGMALVLILGAVNLRALARALLSTP